jgi:8-oxo-dGTP pyrophosphatase MutT (NUDIX family)
MACEPIEWAALDGVEIALAPDAWNFAVKRRAEIDRHFAERRRAQPALWNGKVVLLRGCTTDSGVLRGNCFETDFASFLAWRDWDFPDRGVFNVFAAAALRAADGAYLLGEMAPSTANAGMLTFPCGTPEPADVGADGMLDLVANLRRELAEETGIDGRELAAEPGWIMVRDRCYLALLKRLTSSLSAETLRQRILDHVARDNHPEFSGVRIVRGPADLHSAMPTFVTTFLARSWA